MTQHPQFYSLCEVQIPTRVKEEQPTQSDHGKQLVQAEPGIRDRAVILISAKNRGK